MSSIPPIEGRAAFTEEPIKGARKDPEAVISRAGVWSVLFSIFPILALRRSQNQQQTPEISSPPFHEEEKRLRNYFLVNS
jgi:hypothetical protein